MVRRGAGTSNTAAYPARETRSKLSQRYEELLVEWRAASANTREAQSKLRRKFDAFLAGAGPEPTASEIEAMHGLRDLEQQKLADALQCARAHVLRQP